MTDVLAEADLLGERWGLGSSANGLRFEESVRQGIEFLGRDTSDSAYGDWFIIGISRAYGLLGPR